MWYNIITCDIMLKIMRRILWFMTPLGLIIAYNNKIIAIFCKSTLLMLYTFKLYIVSTHFICLSSFTRNAKHNTNYLKLHVRYRSNRPQPWIWLCFHINETMEIISNRNKGHNMNLLESITVLTYKFHYEIINWQTDLDGHIQGVPYFLIF